MERSPPPGEGQPSDGEGQVPPVGAPDRRQVVDLLADSFAVERSESEWLTTLLGADELAYIFGDGGGDETQD
ncbi:MAG: hypothetical protein ACRYFW_12725 [Janthinobacterium lividum]